ncbi:uncharacterized protein LOC134197460 [Corticium candelabrum]|uniref:uncharacterized protein LOC134197460 n=1 Tax=Corticium candelabrum TaxID=121492 RepID=UPI002E269C25|nr:uncharacterized protein LOC134197460 [Corticium candelabrum]
MIFRWYRQLFAWSTKICLVAFVFHRGESNAANVMNNTFPSSKVQVQPKLVNNTRPQPQSMKIPSFYNHPSNQHLFYWPSDTSFTGSIAQEKCRDGGRKNGRLLKERQRLLRNKFQHDESASKCKQTFALWSKGRDLGNPHCRRLFLKNCRLFLKNRHMKNRHMKKSSAKDGNDEMA